MLAGQELPIQSANIVNNALQTTTSYKPVGVQLYITPQASGPTGSSCTRSRSCRRLRLLAAADARRQQNPSTLVNPIIDSREAETAVTIDDGNTLVISGLRMIRTTTRENKIPGLGDLPRPRLAVQEPPQPAAA